MRTLFLTICLFIIPLAQAATSVSQFGITWTFDKDYTTGQFANGDYWVVGPVKITAISPSGETNGSMLNPDPTTMQQGYNSGNSENPYNSALNVSLKMPLTIQTGSLISSIAGNSGGTTEKTMAVLTVLSTAPPEGSFRPPYCGSDKTIKFNKSQLDYSKLSNLQPTASMPRLKQKAGDNQTISPAGYASTSIERLFERPWIDHIPYWVGRSMHPADNMPDYGQWMSDQVGQAALMLNCNYSNAEKETLMIRFVQFGIDSYGVITSGGINNWTNDGGHASGRLWPIIFAGIVLNDTSMQNVNKIKGVHFGETDQTFYVSQADIDLKGHKDSEGVKQVDYQQSDLGLPEWGINHTKGINDTENTAIYDDRNWSLVTKSGYRICCTANSWTGYILAAHIMGAKDLWNYPALFDYQDRFLSVMKTIGGEIGSYRCWSSWPCEMWERYRANYGCVWTRTNPNDTFSNGSCGGTTTTTVQPTTIPPTTTVDSTSTSSSSSSSSTTSTSSSSTTSSSGGSTTTSSENVPPVANAGQNQVVKIGWFGWVFGFATVQLDGSKSYDTDGTIVSYVWTENGKRIASGISPKVRLAAGVYTITLTVTDNGGFVSTSKTIITVKKR